MILSYPDDANAEELLNVDAEVETSGPARTEAEIVAEILGGEDEVVEVDDDPLLPPSTYSVETSKIQLVL